MSRLVHTVELSEIAMLQLFTEMVLHLNNQQSQIQFFLQVQVLILFLAGIAFAGSVIIQ